MKHGHNSYMKDSIINKSNELPISSLIYLNAIICSSGDKVHKPWARSLGRSYDFFSFLLPSHQTFSACFHCRHLDKLHISDQWVSPKAWESEIGKALGIRIGIPFYFSLIIFNFKSTWIYSFTRI